MKIHNLLRERDAKILPLFLVIPFHLVAACCKFIVVMLWPESIGPTAKKSILVNETIPVNQEWTRGYTH